MPVHAGPADGAQDGAVRASANRAFDRPLDGGWEGGEDDLAALAPDLQDAVAVFLAMTAVSVVAYCTLRGLSATGFYVICGVLGISLGYWAVFVTIASEQFGTNLRATATTTVPNWVRGALVPITFAFEHLHTSGLSLVHSALVLGLGLLSLAGVALWFLPETFGRDLDFVE